MKAKGYEKDERLGTLRHPATSQNIRRTTSSCLLHQGKEDWRTRARRHALILIAAETLYRVRPGPAQPQANHHHTGL
jgi:hypothetical protein